MPSLWSKSVAFFKNKKHPLSFCRLRIKGKSCNWSPRTRSLPTFSDSFDIVGTGHHRDNMEVSEYKKIKRHLDKKKYPRSKETKLLINDILHHQKKAKSPLRVLKSKELDDLLKRVHSDESGEHLGITKNVSFIVLFTNKCSMETTCYMYGMFINALSKKIYCK